MKNVRLPTLLTLLGAAAIPAACSKGDSVNIGTTATVGSQLSDYAATWDGYAEAYAFIPDQSDRVRLTIGADGHGTLQIGDEALLPAATDPNVGYPPGGSLAESGLLVEGFQFPIHATQIQSNRIQLGVNPFDLYAGWCALQTSFPYYETVTTTDGGMSVLYGVNDPDAGTVLTLYGCIPPNKGNTQGDGGCALINPDGTTTTVNCDKAELCASGIPVCQCSVGGCTSTQVADGTHAVDYSVELDAALDSTGKTLTGTLLLPSLQGGLVVERVTVVLTRQ